MSSLFSTSDRKSALWNGLRNCGFLIEDAYINGELCIRVTAPSGRLWLAGKKMSYPMNSHEVHCLAGNKQSSYQLAEQLGIMVPESIYCTDHDSLPKIESFMADRKPVVVKPLDGYQSIGLTLDVINTKQLTAALKKAWCEHHIAIVQRQIMAEEYRFTVLDGEVISVLRRERPQVVGDGVKTIAQLVEEENKARLLLRPEIFYPLWTKSIMNSQEVSQRVLPAGYRYILSQATMVRDGASVYEVMCETSPYYINIAKQFARELGAGLLAVDMFIVDHRGEGNYWFNECNTSPALKLYAAVRNHDNSSIIERIVARTAELLR